MQPSTVTTTNASQKNNSENADNWIKKGFGWTPHCVIV
ncbi:HBR546Wp [Eremothecium sinecaudum]|uniref:HBR546Wp n=1 Tax=Eremothecium sinecaudum TaxID=45286 RepID=A0A109UYF6_9SACH|nr:HBR546Wp [Eremothecium sinecaudum]AMD19447.1 HBR546Wp [Eremothecium sinecaudum]